MVSSSIIFSMKRIALSLAFASLSIICYAQKEVTIKAGTIVSLRSSYSVKAADVTNGQKVDFLVSQDLMVDSVCVIPRGTNVKGIVVESKKSTIAGTKGRLLIRINDMIIPGGDYIPLTDAEVRIYGKNKTPLAVILACLAWPCIFIPGTKAEMPEGHQVIATIPTNCKVKVD